MGHLDQITPPSQEGLLDPGFQPLLCLSFPSEMSCCLGPPWEKAPGLPGIGALVRLSALMSEASVNFSQTSVRPTSGQAEKETKLRSLWSVIQSCQRRGRWELSAPVPLASPDILGENQVGLGRGPPGLLHPEAPEPLGGSETGGGREAGLLGE